MLSTGAAGGAAAVAAGRIWPGAGLKRGNRKWWARHEYIEDIQRRHKAEVASSSWAARLEAKEERRTLEAEHAAVVGGLKWQIRLLAALVVVLLALLVGGAWLWTSR